MKQNSGKSAVIGLILSKILGAYKARKNTDRPFYAFSKKRNS
jgi:hypothetical protein